METDPLDAAGKFLCTHSGWTGLKMDGYMKLAGVLCEEVTLDRV